MNVAEKHIRHYNRLNGNEISKAGLQSFHAALKKDIDSKKIDAHMPYGIEVICIEKRISKAIKEMNGANRIVHVKKPIALGNPKNLIIAQTAHGPEVVRAKKAVHYHHEDITMLYGLQEIKNDKHLDSKPLDGPNDTTYQVITDRILALLKEGGLIWRKPWNSKVHGPSDLAHNYVTKYMYRSGNYYLNFLNEAMGGLTLLIDGKKKNVSYKHSAYFTFKQVTDLGGSIIKGEKGWPVVYFKWLYKDERKNRLVPEAEARDEKGKLKQGYSKFPGLFYYTVFNYDQCSGLKINIAKSPKRSEKEKIESAEQIIDDMPQRPTLKSGGDRAYYSPSGDYVQMPKIDNFKVEQQYYSVFFHELIHSTGSLKRLERDLSGKFGNKSYAFEELIAELGASFLCGQSGILYYTMKNSAAYIKSWTGALKKEMEEDPRFFLRAASAAQKAADFILEVKENEGVKVKKEKPVERTIKPVVKEPSGRSPVKRKKSKTISVPGVKASVSKAIDDLVSNAPNKYGKKAMAMQMLYTTFRNDQEEEIQFDTDSLKFKLLDKEGWIEYQRSGYLKMDWYTISEKGKDVLKAIEARLSSLRVKKQGGELFPNLNGPKKKKPAEFAGLGFITADQAPEKPKGTFTLPGTIGAILGHLQRYKLEIVIAGETHSGKSELGKQIADAFISIGDEVGWIDWEQGGLQSRDTHDSIKRNVLSENRKKLFVSSEVPKTLEAVKNLANKFKVIVLDSGSSLKQVTNAWIDELREQYPQTVWIILMQQNEKGGTRGGAAAEFDSPVVLKTYRPDERDFRKNYAYVFKNRGNPQTTGKYYLIADKIVVNEEPK